MLRFLSLPLLVFAFISIASLSLASSHEVDLKRDVRAAKSVVMGTVEKTSSYYGDDGEIYTDVTLRVAANLKDGFGAPDSITFTAPGGEVGDVGVLFTAAPRFSEGEPVMVFLEETISGSPGAFAAGASTLRAAAKYTMNLDEVPGLGISPLELMLEVGREAGESGAQVRDSEWRRGAEFLAKSYSAAVAAPPAGAAVCYKLMGPKWAAKAATYKLDATLPTGFGAAVNAAAASWTAAGAAYRFSLDGASANVVNFAPIAMAGVLAQTRVSYRPSTNTIVGFSLTYSSNYPWTMTGETNRFDVQAIGTHEMGHALGLDHPSEATCAEQTMWASAAAGETKKRSLEGGDKAGEVTLYGAASAGWIAPPTMIPAVVPSFSYGFLFSAPALNQPFQIALLGRDFSVATLQFVFKGPGCPAMTGCVLATDTLTHLTATQAIGTFTATAAGSYTINVRNGPTGALSPSTALLQIK